MAITVNIYYRGENSNARKFAEEMTSRGIVGRIRAEAGNLKYEYFFPMDLRHSGWVVPVIRHRSHRFSSPEESALSSEAKSFSSRSDSVMRRSVILSNGGGKITLSMVWLSVYG